MDRGTPSHRALNEGVGYGWYKDWRVQARSHLDSASGFCLCSMLQGALHSKFLYSHVVVSLRLWNSMVEKRAKNRHRNMKYPSVEEKMHQVEAYHTLLDKLKSFILVAALNS